MGQFGTGTGVSPGVRSWKSGVRTRTGSKGRKGEGGGRRSEVRGRRSSLIPQRSSFISHPSSLIPHPSSLIPQRSEAGAQIAYLNAYAWMHFFQSRAYGRDTVRGVVRGQKPQEKRLVPEK